MPEGYEPPDVPLYEDQATRDEQYRRAEREEVPFFAVERYDEGYAVTYDLLPAGRELAKPARKELEERLTREVERLVADPSVPTTEVGKTVGESLGTVSLFEREETARRVAAFVSRTVLDGANWVEASPPEPPTGGQFRRN
ncbi:hypothetical protein BRC92_07245 [Halobacteriales archaeon QS_4_69_31]|nr:MAG: hypothetical protein BRC92_07245 [Halobacteriales archaeon QS_4_69_31]